MPATEFIQNLISQTTMWVWLIVGAIIVIYVGMYLVTNFRVKRQFGVGLAKSYNCETKVYLTGRFYVTPYTEAHKRNGVYYQDYVHDARIKVNYDKHQISLFRYVKDGEEIRKAMLTYFPILGGAVDISPTPPISPNRYANVYSTDGGGGGGGGGCGSGAMLGRVINGILTEFTSTPSASFRNFEIPEDIREDLEITLDEADKNPNAVRMENGDYINAVVEFTVPVIVFPFGTSIDWITKEYHQSPYAAELPYIAAIQHPTEGRTNNINCYYVFFNNNTSEVNAISFRFGWLNQYVLNQGRNTLAERKEFYTVIESKKPDNYRIPFFGTYIRVI